MEIAQLWRGDTTIARYAAESSPAVSRVAALQLAGEA